MSDKFLRVILIIAVLCAGVGICTRAQADVKLAAKIPNSVIVVFNGQTLPADAAQHIQQAGGRVVSTLDGAGIIVAAPDSVDGPTLIANLNKDPAIQDADYDLVFDLIAPTQVWTDDDVGEQTHFPHPLPTFSPALPADFFYTSSPQEWAVKRVGAQGGGIPGGASGAWDITKGAGITIAILDTGVNPIHPDISPNLVGNISEILAPSACDDGSPNDQQGHGTWTSSLAAGAFGPSTGLVIGVAPEASILNVKVLQRVPGAGNDTFTQCLNGGGSGAFSWVLKGILDASAAHADVISMSLGGFVPKNLPKGEGAAVFSAFNRVANFATSHGAVIVAAAGNSALDLSKIGPVVELPAGASNIIAVMATTNPDFPPPFCTAGTDCLASYSDFGVNLHGLSAPGGDVPGGGCAFSGSPCNPTGFIRGACSAGIPGTDFGLPIPGSGNSMGCFSFNFGGGAGNHIWYVQATGTSASTPLVAGVAALVKAANPSLSPGQIRTILQQTAQDLGKPGYDGFFNFGLVNATAAVHAAVGR
jgi:subtilisin family serine protease